MKLLFPQVHSAEDITGREFKRYCLDRAKRFPKGARWWPLLCRAAHRRQARASPPIYPYAADVAKQNDELALFRETNKTNGSCAHAIDAAIRDSNYKLYHYDLPTAAMSVISEYGAERVQWVLASVVQRSERDGRYSGNNKEWAKSFDTPHLEYAIVVNNHPAVLGGFISRVRETVLEKKMQLEQPDGVTDEYKYYVLHRPIVAGDIPSEPKPKKISNFSDKFYVENSAYSARGSIIYKQPLTEKQVVDFELRAASTSLRQILRTGLAQKRQAGRSPPQAGEARKKIRAGTVRGTRGKRTVRMEFVVSHQEVGLIQERMAEMGTGNLSAYLRKMAIDGYIVHLDLSDERELTKLLRACSNNLNQ